MDQYGRPQFGDWMGIAQGLKGVNQDREEQEALAIAQKVAEDPSYKPEGVNPSVAWRGIVEGNRLAADKMQRTESGMRMKALQWQMDQEDALREWAKVAPSLGKEGGRQAAYDFFNKNLKNGQTIRALGDGNIEITGIDGTKTVQAEPSVEEINQMALGLTDPKAMLTQQIDWDQKIRGMNAQSLLEAKELRDPVSGKTLGVRAATVFDRGLNSVRTSFRHASDGTELTKDEVKDLKKKGYISAEEMEETLKLQTLSARLQNESIERLSKLMDIKSTGLDIEMKKKGFSEKDELSLVYQDLSKTFGIAPNQVDANGKPYTIDEETAVAVRNYLRGKGYDASWRKAEDGKWSMVGIQKGALPMDADKQKDVRGTGLAGASPQAPKQSPKKTQKVPQRKSGESIEAYLARTRGK